MSLRFIAHDGSEQAVEDDTQLFAAVNRGEVSRETLVYDDAKKAWIKAGGRFPEAWAPVPSGNPIMRFLRGYGLWVAYPVVIVLYIIAAEHLRLGDSAMILAGKGIAYFIMALLVLVAISGRWSVRVKQRLRSIALLVFVSGFLVLSAVQYKQKMEAADGGVAGTTGAGDAPPAVVSQLSQREVMKRFKDLLTQRVLNEKNIAAEVETLGLDKLFDPPNFAVPNAIDRNRKTIQRYQELIQQSKEIAETHRNETDRLFREQAVLASGRDTYEKNKKETMELEHNLTANLMAQVEAMSRFNEFLSEHWNHIILDSEGMGFDSPETEEQARMLAGEMDNHAAQIGQLMRKVEQFNRDRLQKFESFAQ